MARIPVARKHRGYIRVRWRGKETQFGRWDDPAAWRRFEQWRDRMCIDLGLPVGGVDPAREQRNGMTLATLARRYLAHARVYYRHPDGTPTSEAKEMARAIEDLIRALGHELDPTQFGVQQLRQFRSALVARGLSRPVVNQRVSRVCRVFRWAGEEGHVPEEIWYRLKVLTPLRRGRSEAPEPPDVRPVPEHVLRATLPLLSPVVRGIATFQRLTGCRPDEACRVRACDIDRRGDVWVYSPTCPVTGKPRHKLAWRDLPRPILIGPRLQAILEPILAQRGPADYLFRPKDQPRARKKLQPHYRTASYYRAILRAIEEENRRRIRQTKADQAAGADVQVVRLPRWCPLQLRHLAATVTKERVGWRAAQELLGHSLESTTRGYVEENMPAALDAVRRLG